MGKFKNKYRIPSARLQHWDYGFDAAYFITICTKNKVHYFGRIADKRMHLNETGKLAEKFWGEIPGHFPFAELDAFVVMPNHIHGIVIIRRDAIHRVSNGVSGDGGGDSDAMNRVSTGISGDDGDSDAMNRVSTGISGGDGDSDAINRISTGISGDDGDSDAMNRVSTGISGGDGDSDAINRVSTGVSGDGGADAMNPQNRDAMNRVSTGVGGFAGRKNPMIHENISRIVRWYKGRCTFEIRKIHADFEWQSRFHDHIIRSGGSFERIRDYIENNPLNWEGDCFG